MQRVSWKAVLVSCRSVKMRQVCVYVSSGVFFWRTLMTDSMIGRFQHKPIHLQPEETWFPLSAQRSVQSIRTIHNHKHSCVHYTSVQISTLTSGVHQGSVLGPLLFFISKAL